MCILCDSICAWRTIVLWNKNKRVTAILVACILKTTAIAGVSAVSGIQEGSSNQLSENFYFAIFPIVGTNVLSTGLIAWKAWQRRITVGKHLREGSGSVKFERVFALLIESGVIYCCIWIIYLLSFFGMQPTPSFTLIVFVSGIYPTLIIILISKQISPVEHYSTYSTLSTLSVEMQEMQVTGVPTLGPPRDGSMP